MRARPECFPRVARTEHRRRTAEERSGYVKLCEVQPRSLRFDEVLEFFFGTRVMVDLSKRQFLHFALANLQN
jgi:hypothetical protein